jgi:hypothetical protein
MTGAFLQGFYRRVEGNAQFASLKSEAVLGSALNER